MASFILDKKYEVVEEITSPTIEEVEKRADPGTFKARSIKYQHPRFKSRFSSPSYVVSFRENGRMQSLSEDSLEDLDSALRQTCLEAANSPNPR